MQSTRQSSRQRPVTSRACATCRFYEPSNVWRNGWCRNPKLYAPQESHPVAADTLDCENADSRSYWEAAAGSGPSSHAGARGSAERNGDAILLPGKGAQPSGGERMADGPRRAGMSEERTVSYQPEERYWTDYLRIALPVVGLLILIGLLWYWASALIGNGSSQPPTPNQAVITPVNESTPAPPTATAVIIAPTPGPPPAPTATPVPQVAAPAEPTATPPPAAAGTENPCANMPVHPAGTLVVTTDEVNLRESPTTESASIALLPAGTQLQVTGEFSEAGQCDWWPVTTTETGQSGFVREDFLQAVAT